MKKYYTQEKDVVFYIEIEDIIYTVYCTIKEYVQPPDYSSWESDIDYFGYTEVLDYKITEIDQEEPENFIKLGLDEETHRIINTEVKHRIEKGLYD